MNQRLLGILLDSFPKILLPGLTMTIPLTVISFSLALIIAVVTAMVQFANVKVLRSIARFYIWVVRGTPLLVQLYVVFYGLPNLGIVLGQNLLPVVGNLADKVASLVTKVSEFAQENPKAVQTVLKLVAGLAGLKVAGLGTKLGFLEAKKGVLGIMGAFEKFKALKAAESLGGVATKAGGIAVKLGPIVAVAAAIGAAIYYVANNLEDVRAKIQQTFGDEGLKIFDQIWASITMVGDAFKTAFAGVSTEVFSTLQQILPTIISTLQTAAT